MRVWVKARSKPAHFVCTTGRFCAHEGAEGVFLRLAAGLAGFALRSARDCVLPPRSANPCSRMEHSDCGAGINPSGDLRKLCNRRDGASGRAAARLSDPSPKKSMKSHPVGVLIFLIGLALGSSSPRAADQLEPLWAYGFATPPALGDKAVRQAMPSRKLRPNEDPDEQTDLRHVAGSTAADPRVDVRDGGDLIDRFPGDHRPMLNVIAHGPASPGPASRVGGGRLVALANRQGVAGKCSGHGATCGLFHPANGMLLQRRACVGSPSKAQHADHGRAGEGHDRRGNRGCGGVFWREEMDAVDAGDRNRLGAEDADRR